MASRLIDIRGTRNDVAEVRVEDKDYKLEIWDTAGQERFRSLAPMSLQPYRVQGRRVDVGEGPQKRRWGQKPPTTPKRKGGTPRRHWWIKGLEGYWEFLTKKHYTFFKGTKFEPFKREHISAIKMAAAQAAGRAHPG